MHRNLKLTAIFFLLIIIGFGQHTIGLTNYTLENTPGYVLFAPMTSTNTYLIDKCGNKVHEWNTSSYQPALSSFLLEDGSLLRTGQLNNPLFNEGGSGGIIERFDWNDNLVWSYSISDTNICLHHDIRPLPNGNILCIAWDSRSKAEAVLNGKDPSYNQTHLWSEKIIELQPIGTDSAIIVWEWSLFDHLIQDFDNTKNNYGVVADHPELININYFPGAQNTEDWIHLNSIDYNADLDQILLSSHRFCEAWIIDHSTTTAEAASHNGGNSGKGGDILYRWGNPQAYQRGNPSTKVFYGQHHATWIPPNFPNAGKIMVFNNGLGRPGNYSSIDMIDPPLNVSNNYDIPPSGAILPTSLDWSYLASTPSDFYSSNISGVYPLSNGSFMITNGANGVFFEIDQTEQETWEYVNPTNNSGIGTQGDSPSGNLVFRCNFYDEDYTGLQGQTLVSLGEIEFNPSQPSICDSVLSLNEEYGYNQDVKTYPNPFSNHVTLEYSSEQTIELVLYDCLGQQVLIDAFSQSKTIDTQHLKSGIYYYHLSDAEGVLEKGKLIKN